ncbi:MAG: hypothetical protein ACUVQ1_04530 [Candidatus Kapaibacteriales bacterium]
MELSNDTKEVLKFLDYTSGNSLRKRNDLGVLLEILASNNQAEVANKLIFIGSALWKTVKIPQSSKDLDLHNFNNEIDSLMINLTELISYTIELCPELETKQRFDIVYLGKSPDCHMNLIDLAFDLNELKKIQIKFKTGKGKL